MGLPIHKTLVFNYGLMCQFTSLTTILFTFLGLSTPSYHLTCLGDIFTPLVEAWGNSCLMESKPFKVVPVSWTSETAQTIILTNMKLSAPGNPAQIWIFHRAMATTGFSATEAQAKWLNAGQCIDSVAESLNSLELSVSCTCKSTTTYLSSYLFYNIDKLSFIVCNSPARLAK